jgi:hypothetical protein
VWLVVGALSIALGVWPDVGALMIGCFAAFGPELRFTITPPLFQF